MGKPLTHGQLFAGIGGFGLAAQWAGIKNIWANEIDPYCCQILRQNFEGLEVYEQDIREIGRHNLKPVDIISGGFPCQPFSSAGKRKGTEDNRYLWPEMLRVIRELKPAWVVGENVAGLVSMENGKTLEGILSSLEAEGYSVETFLIPACATGAQHRRNRLWIIGCLSDSSRFRQLSSNKPEKGFQCTRRGPALSQFNPLYRRSDKFYRFDGSEITRNTNGLSRELDQDQDRIKALGNAIVPQVAYEIFKAIIQYDTNHR